MINAYLTLTAYEGTEWKDYLESIGLLDVFGELFGQFVSPDSQRKIMRYILWAYSRESDKLIQGADWETNKKSIYKMSGLPGDLWESIGLLSNYIVLRTIHRWLEFQGESVFKQLQTLKDLKMEMQLSCVGAIMKNTGETDYEQKRRNAITARELDDMIEALEPRCIENTPHLKDAIREARFLQRGRVHAGVEHFTK